MTVYSQNIGKILAKININEHILPILTKVTVIIHVLIQFYMSLSLSIYIGKNNKIQNIFKH